MKTLSVKEYPRIFSLSTIGLIHHYNIDYIFHPFRTDFSGESGVGKTTIANLLQLIFVGAKHFKPASNPAYKPSGYVLKPHRLKQQNLGYAFLNIEMVENQYVVVGVFLKENSNDIQHFIIQNGYDWDKLDFYPKPMLHKSLLKNDEIIPLSEHLKNENFRCEKFKTRAFQEILYKNEILPFDLYISDAKNLKFANILKSFSAGKNLEWDKSSKLQNFLFDNEIYERIVSEYKEKRLEIENRYQDSYKNDKDIEVITKKAGEIQKLTELKRNKDVADKEYRIASKVYLYHKKNKS